MLKFSQPMVPTRKHGPPLIIRGGPMRTGTLSMARAYDILDLRAHHGLDMAIMGRKEAKRQWAMIVQRDYDKWWASFQVQVLDTLMHPLAQPILSLLMKIHGGRGSESDAENSDGSFDAKDGKGIRVNSRKTYVAYYDRIRKIVPLGRRLEYRLEEGWEPLCAFLGKDVPDVPFSNVNNKVEHEARKLMEYQGNLEGMLCYFEAMAFWISGNCGNVVRGLAFLTMKDLKKVE